MQYFTCPERYIAHIMCETYTHESKLPQSRTESCSNRVGKGTRQTWVRCPNSSRGTARHLRSPNSSRGTARHLRSPNSSRGTARHLRCPNSSRGTARHLRTSHICTSCNGVMYTQVLWIQLFKTSDRPGSQRPLSGVQYQQAME